jgi:hypothetical protein
MTNAFTFNELTLRPATEDDRELCQRWIDADPDHRGKITADFFLEGEAGVECMVLVDKWGQPRFFFRQQRALRIHMQFPPNTTSEERTKTREALTFGFGWLKHIASRHGYRELIFESTVVPLMNFCKNRFGFSSSPNELVCPITPPDPPQAA